MPRIRCLSFSMLFVLCAGSMAQRPIGIPTPVNGVSPRLQSQPFWLGNDGFSYQVSNAPGGGLGVLALSFQRTAIPLAGINLGVSLSPTDIISLTSFTTDAAGSSNIGIPLVGSTDPALAGILLYAQAAIADPASGLLGATQTLQLDVSLRPLMFVAEDSQSPFFADPYTGLQTPIPANYSGALISAKFINGGRDLLLLTTSGIFHCDSQAPAVGFTQWATGPYEGLEWDAVRRRAVSYSPAGGMQVFDADRSNASFGQLLQQFPAPGPMALSADGTRGFRQNGGNFEYVDFDPASPLVGQAIFQVAAPPQLGNPIASEVSISSDGRLGTWYYTISLPGSTGRHIMDLTTGTWIDHNPALAGLQPLGVTSAPALGASDSILWQRDDAAGYVFGIPAGPRRIDRNLDNFAQYTITPIVIAPLPVPLPIPFFWGEVQLSLSSSGRFLATVVTSVASLAGPRNFYLVDLTTGARIPWFTLPTGGLSFVTAWR